eukprot:2232064-Amphidinium_carterae.1
MVLDYGGGLRTISSGDKLTRVRAAVITDADYEQAIKPTDATTGASGNNTPAAQGTSIARKAAELIS